MPACVPLLMAVLAAACDSGLTCDPPGGGCTGDVLDAYSTNIKICGFPVSQVDLSEVGPPLYGTPMAWLRVGQRLTLTLNGELDRVATVAWGVGSPMQGSQLPQVRLTPTGRYQTLLEGVAPGGDSRHDAIQVSGDLVFKDGSQDGVRLEACQPDGSGQWVGNIKVVP
jgi:hypothetical protein